MNIVIIGTFIIVLLCLYEVIFNYMDKIKYLRFTMCILCLAYIYTRDDSKDILVLTYVLLIFIVLGVIHGVIRALISKEKKEMKYIMKSIYTQVLNYNILVLISLIMDCLNNLTFAKFYNNLYIDFFEILIGVLIYNILVSFFKKNLDTCKS